MENPKQIKFRDLTERYSKLIYRICWKYSSGDEGLCRELVQDSYVTIWFHLSSLSFEASSREERTWIALQCRSSLSHRWRHLNAFRRRFSHIDEQMMEALPDTDDSNVKEMLETFAIGLNPKEQKLLTLLLEGYTRAEISELMDISVENVKKMRQRIITKISQNINP